MYVGRKKPFVVVLAVLLVCLAIREGGAVEGAGGALLAEQPSALPSLEDLESYVTDGPEVLASLSSLARDGYTVELQTERMSPKAFAALTYGYNDEPVTETAEERYSYGKLAGTVGVSFPLLGTWTRQKIDGIHAEIARSESRYRTDLLTLQNLTALRKAYALLWIEGRRLPILEAFLSDEEKTMELLEARSKKNLLLAGDLFEFSTMFGAARREIVLSKVTVSRALSTIALATGRRWGLPASIPAPALPGLYDLAFNLERHPEILAMNEASRLYAEIARISGKPDREANLDFGLIGTYDFPGTYGTGAFVAVTVKEPFGTLTSGRDSAKLAASADAERARWDLALTAAKLQGNFDEQLLWGDYARETLRFETTRLVAAREAVRERTLRHGKIAGDTLEQLIRSRYACMRTAMNVIDTESLSLQTYIELVSMLRPDAGAGERIFPLDGVARRDELLSFSPLYSAAPQSPAFPPVPAMASCEGSSAPSGWVPVNKAFYVWDAEPFLDDLSRQETLRRFAADGYTRILISFTSREIAALRKPEGKARLEKFLIDAEKRKLVVDLLLGDPAWILPAARDKLRDLLAFFRPFGFRAVHLDLEPDMLPNAVGNRARYVKELRETLRMATDAAGRPVGISIHPRYFEGDFASLGGDLVRGLGLHEVALMIYSTDPFKTGARFRAICAAFPDVPFSLAQSVERALPESESYFGRGIGVFDGRMRKLAARVSSPNAHDLIVQAWKDYLEMKP